MTAESQLLREQSQVVADLERKKSLLKTINDFAIELLDIPTETDLVWYVAREVVAKLGFVDCVVYLVDREHETLRQVAAIGVKNPRADLIVNPLIIPIGKGITGRVAQSKQAMIVDDLSADGRYIPDVEPALSEICVPLIIDENVVGVIDCEDPRKGHFGEEHLETLNTIAAMASAKLKIIDEARRAEKRAEELRQLNRQLHSEILERRKAEERLRESEDRFRAITEASPVPLIITRRSDGEILYANPTAGPALGLAAEQLVGRLITDFYADPSLRGEPLAALERDRLVRNSEIEMRKADGSPISTIHSMQVIEYRGHEAVLGGFYDITERKHLEERLRQAQKMEALGQLTGGVAHDFNNLLAIILAHAELVEESAGESLESAAAILRAAERGAQLTQRLLSFSRSQPLDSRPIKLGDLVRGLHQLLQRTLGETIEIEIAAAPELWEAVADPSQLENALLNLAINARDAMPAGGKLVIQSANVSLGSADLSGQRDMAPGDYVSVTVRDDGIGMSPEVLEHVFEPFFTTKDVGEGSGLGLSMVYGFAKQSGGNVMIQSAPGEGTVATLYLPRARDAGIPAATADMTSAPAGRGETVLVVEDEPDVRSMIIAMLDRLGYRVLSAKDARAGLDILALEPAVDLILSDVVLPGGIDGPSLAEQARVSKPGIKVLFMSGYVERPAGRRARPPEGSDVLGKPFRIMELAQKVRAILDS